MKLCVLPAVAVAALALVAGPACSRPKPAVGAAPATPAPAAKPAEERHPLTGVITAVDAARLMLVIRHDEIKGYMPAMTMEFLVTAGDAAVAKPGQRVRGEMVVSPGSDIRLEKIWPADPVAVDTVAAGARALREDTHNRGKEAYREIGETIPNFALYDQEGRVVQSARFRGKQLMINFIFSRCPIATMCPASTAKMMQVQQLAREAAVANLELVSITLDPAYDTPGVLKEYARVRGIDTANFSFLTGPENAIKDLLEQFGVIAEFRGDLITHTLTTLLIDEQGKIRHRADGSAWEPKEFGAKLRKQ
ncbi:MAG: redoxin domain-containing protein [Opitutus sp.]|nr:redoxin domain-containing protein [Opitutus sp.]